MQAFWKLSTKAICAGRNFVAHAHELNNPLPAQPFFFLKPTSAYLPFGEVPVGGVNREVNVVEYPKSGGSVHHELELSVVIGERARDVGVENALDYVAGYCISLDMTLRDVQSQQKEKRLPWTPAKAFDTSLPLGPFIDKELIPDPNNITIELTVDGEMRQTGSTSLMIFNVQRLISDASKMMTLFPGDIVMTGTPDGVGPVEDGKVLRASVVGLEEFSCEFTCKGL